MVARRFGPAGGYAGAQPVSTRTAVLLAAPVPALVIGTYAVLRLVRVNPQTEPGMGDFLTASFFVGGAAVCYFAGVLHGVLGARGDYFRWLLPTVLMVALGADETFMVHERVSDALRIDELVVFAIYGLLLLASLYQFRTAPRTFWMLLAAFACFCGTSQASDHFTGHEGLVTIAGRIIDYEQVFEILGSACLCGAFATLAGSRLLLAIRGISIDMAMARAAAGQGAVPQPATIARHFAA